MLRKFLLGMAVTVTLSLSGSFADDASTIAGQKWDVEVSAALSKLNKLSSTDAENMLNRLIRDLNEESLLTDAKRTALKNQVQNKLNSYTNASKGSGTPAPAKNNNSDDINHEIRQELNSIRSLQQKGENVSADVKLRKLMEKYPGNSILLATREQNSRSGAVTDAEKLNKTRAAGESSALRGVESSAANSTGDVSYGDPAAWKKMSEKRLAAFDDRLVKMSDREKKIMQSLEQMLTRDFVLNDTTFETILKDLEKEIGFPLVISKMTMDDMNITYDQKLTRTMPAGVNKRALLRSILSDFGLTYIIENENILVLSFIQAKTKLRTAVLDIKSITMLGGAQNVNDLIKLIKNQVEPQSWDSAGGLGSITYDRVTGALIIKNTAEVLYNIGSRSKK